MGLCESRAVATSAARTVTGNSGWQKPPQGGVQLHIAVNVTAASGTTPTLGLSIQWSHDQSAGHPADPVDAFTSITAVGSAVKTFQVRAPYYQVVWTIGGTTPSFTFVVNEFVSG